MAAPVLLTLAVEVLLDPEGRFGVADAVGFEDVVGLAPPVPEEAAGVADSVGVGSGVATVVALEFGAAVSAVAAVAATANPVCAESPT